LTAVSCVSNTG